MSFLKAVFKDGLIYTLPTLISQGIAIFLIPLYTRILSPADYGVFDLLLAFGLFVNLCVSLEISQGNAWYYIHEKDEKEKKKYASTAFFFTLSCYGLFLIAALLFSGPLSKALLGDGNHTHIFQLSIAYIWFNGIFNFLQNQLRWDRRSRDFATASLIMSIVTPVLALSLAYWGGLGLYGVLMGMAGGAMLASLYALMRQWGVFVPYLGREQLARMLSYSLPLVPSGIFVFFSYYIDRLMIRHFMSLDDVGLYGIAYRLSMVTGLLVVGFRMSLTPLVFAHHEKPEVRESLATILRLFFAFGLLLCLGAGLFSAEIFMLMTVPEYYPAADIMPILVPAVLAANMYIFAPGIDIVKRTDIILYINMAVATLNVALNWVLIPRFGLEGAALSTLIGGIALFVFYMIFSQKFYFVPHRWGRMVLAALLVGGLVFAGSLLQLGFVAGLAVKALIGLLGVGAVFVSRLVTVQDIRDASAFVRSRRAIAA